MPQEKTIALVVGGSVLLALVLIGAWALWPSEVERLRRETQNLKASIESLETKNQRLLSARDEMKSQIKSQEREISNLKAQAKETEASQEEAIARNKQLRTEKKELTIAIKTLKGSLSRAHSSSQSDPEEPKAPKIPIWDDTPPDWHEHEEMTNEESAEVFLAEVEYKVSAASLWKTYQGNEIYADAKYKGRVLEVSGEIHSITHDGLGTPSVIIDVGEWELGSIKCDVIVSALHTLISLHKGVRVTMRGKCTGKVMMFVGLENCTVASP